MKSAETLPGRGKINWNNQPDRDYETKAADFAGQIKGQLSGIELLNVLQHKLTLEEIDYVANVCGETAALSRALLEVNAPLFLRFSDAETGQGSYNHRNRLITLSVSNQLNPLISRYREAQLLGNEWGIRWLLKELGLRATVAHECYHQHQSFRYPKSAHRSIAAGLLHQFGYMEDYSSDHGERAAELFAFGLLRKQADLKSDPNWRKFTDRAIEIAIENKRFFEEKAKSSRGH